MSVPYTRAPHQGGMVLPGGDSPHAALLIDFDNVTMGMRSDLSKELKTLLDSDVIKGKVSVQRAYADWRRYPQYIVPLSEASVDLIFAPAYGSNKKNATDIRMAIDALELVFVRPEIGTFILLTGDSDFSSLVLKLKEYGKYVIGVGIQESSSDILVQNCDEYYSYTTLTGLTKTTELPGGGRDPWVLVKDAVAKMVQRDDVMRSDRLKQVMQEIDPAFDEGAIGYSKFSKFLTEASSRGLVSLKKLDNGQYEIAPTSKGRASGRSDGRRDRGRGRGRDRRERPSREAAPEARAVEPSPEPAGDPLRDAYDLLRDALVELKEAGRHPARDSDVKRKMLESQPDFDEAELGFPKFSRFMQQAEEHGVVALSRGDAGNIDVALPGEAPAQAEETPARPRVEPRQERAARPAPEAEEPKEEATVIEVEPPKRGWFGLRLGPRKGSTRRRGADEAPPIFEGQTIDTASDEEGAPELVGQPTGVGAADGDGAAYAAAPAQTSSATATSPGLEGLGLPTDHGAIVRYLAHRYKGVGEKTAETLVEELGVNVFRTLHEDPDAIARIVPPKRAEQVLEAWRADYERRVSSKGGGR
jgi:uncharacterized protein (TIGR00288 family)